MLAVSKVLIPWSYAYLSISYRSAAQGRRGTVAHFICRIPSS